MTLALAVAVVAACSPGAAAAGTGAAALAQARRSGPVLRIESAAPRSLVIVDGIRHGRVDDKGTRVVSTLAAGRHTVVVRQTGFADHKQAVTLAAGRTATVTPRRAPLTDDAELAFQRAEELAASGKTREAIAEYRAAVDARGGRYTEANIGLARALLVVKETEQATAAINAALEAAPRDVEAVAVSALVLRDRGFYEEAIATYRKAAAIAPTRAPEAYAGLGIVLAEQGDHAGAVEALRKAVAQNADAEPILYQLLGHSYEQLGRSKEAISAYDRFLALAPTSSLASAVRSVVERLRTERETGEVEDEGDVNPYAPPE